MRKFVLLQHVYISGKANFIVRQPSHISIKETGHSTVCLTPEGEKFGDLPKFETLGEKVPLPCAYLVIRGHNEVQSFGDRALVSKVPVVLSPRFGVAEDPPIVGMIVGELRRRWPFRTSWYLW